jgi:very-short-patch-repair endonuclease
MGAEARAIVKLAARQCGVVSTAQLAEAGFDHPAIKRWLRAGRLQRMHRGVFRVTAVANAPRAAEMAALLACGVERSVVSHRSAAKLWRLPVEWSAPVVEVTVTGRNPARRPGIAVYHVPALHRRDVRRIEGIPASAPARTLMDLAVVLPFGELEIVYAEARGRGLVHARGLTALLASHRGRHGVGAVRRLLEVERDRGVCRSKAEHRLQAMVQASTLPMPRANTRVEGFEVDFLWPDQKLIVEVDGYAFHAGKQSFERDRDRDAALAARGYVVMRVTWEQLMSASDVVLERIAGALAVRT